MRVVNDRDEKSEAAPLGFFDIFFFSFFSALGICTATLCPLPMILAHLRLAGPWPRVTAVFGALLAVTLFQQNFIFVIILFVFGLVAADGIHHELRAPRLFGSALLSGLGSALLGLFILAQSNGRNLWVQAFDLADRFMNQTREVLSQSANAGGAPIPAEFWDSFRSLLIYESPFFLVAFLILSLWTSVGLAAHLGWLAEPHAYSGKALRRMQLPRGASFLFIMFLAVGFFAIPAPQKFAVDGITLILAAAMFIQGTIVLSRMIRGRATSIQFRTIIYLLAGVSGLFVLLGVVSPLLNQKRDLEEVI